MIEKFNAMTARLTELSDLIKLLRIDPEYINIIKKYENGKN